MTALLLASVVPNMWTNEVAGPLDLTQARIAMIVMTAFGLAALPVRAYEFDAVAHSSVEARHGLSPATVFWLGWTSLALTFATPLHWLSERLFVAHMIEHQVLVVVAAPLLAFARPWPAMSWRLPLSWRRPAGAFMTVRPLTKTWAAIRHPLSATLLQAATLWVGTRRRSTPGRCATSSPIVWSM